MGFEENDKLLTFINFFKSLKLFSAKYPIGNLTRKPLALVLLQA